MATVTVIIPTYNRASVIRRAIDSVLAQTFEDFELIVVDDGSDDETELVLLQYGDRIRVVRQSNRGVSSARNRGVAEAEGRLIAFLDSDDEWLPDKLDLQVDRYHAVGEPFVCHTDEIWMRDGRELNQKAQHRKQGGRFFVRALERCLISPSSVMVSRGMFDLRGLFDESLPAAEDYDLWLRITAFHPVDFIPIPLVIKHGDRSDQLSRTVPAIDRYRIRAIEKILARPDLAAEYRTAARLELVRKCGIVAAGAEKRDNMEEARHYRELAQRYTRDND